MRDGDQGEWVKLERLPPRKTRKLLTTKSKAKSTLIDWFSDDYSPAINIVTCCTSLGGAERHSVLLARELARLGYKITFINLGANWPEFQPFIYELERAGIAYDEQLVESDINIWWGNALIGQPVRNSVYIVHSVGELAEQNLLAANPDYIVAVSEQAAQMARFTFPDKKIVAIANGVDVEEFAGCNPRRRGEPGDPFVIGYLGRYAPEKNLKLAIWALRLLPEHVSLKLRGQGPTKDDLIELAAALGLSSRCDIGDATEDRRGFFESVDCLLLTSEREGAPLAAIEAAHAGVPVVCTPVGDLPLIFSDGERGLVALPVAEDVAEAIIKLVDDPVRSAWLASAAQIYARQHLDAETMGRGYAELIEQIKESLDVEDKSDEITTFVITSGEPSTAQCIRRIEKQTVKTRIEIIENVSPMWRAFNEMHARCQTPYFVQVDADMLLQRDAIKRLYEGICFQGEECAMYCGWLWGDAEERPITGVKIYDHRIVKNYPYVDSISCEQPQFEAMKKDGYLISIGPGNNAHDCLGVHWSLQTPEMAFRRWRRLMQKFRARPEHMGWLSEMPSIIERRVCANPSEINLAIYRGIIAGSTGSLPQDTEIDISAPDQDSRRLNWLLSTAAQGPREMALYLTSRCNHRCYFCRKEHCPEGAAPDITPELLVRALNQFPTVASVCMAGFGEPLLASNLPEIFRILRERSIFISMVTNGSLLKTFVDDLVQWGVGSICVSLNAGNATDHAKIVGADTWESVVCGIGAAVKRKIPTEISMVVTRQNIGDVANFLKLARHLNVATVHLHNLLPHAGAESDEFLQQVISTESDEALAILDELKRSKDGKLVKTWPRPIGLGADKCPQKCESPFVFVGIDGNGYVSPCRRVFPPSAEFGQIHAATWRGAVFSKRRSEILGDLPMDKTCSRCFAMWSDR